MKIINKFKKSEKGSITVMVLTLMLFMLVVITASYLSISNKSIGQNRKVSKISNQYQVTEDDMEQEYKKVINNVSVKDYVRVGDYVDYEPTKTDVGKTQAVDSSKLTYTSPTGKYSEDVGIITHGNGYTSQEEGGGQTFTAKQNDGTSTGLKWRVLSVSDDKVELVSDLLVKTDANANFVLQGGTGYLYAEQELNEVCKIYGYGYGADITARATYTIGGPEDEEFQQIKTIEEPSGARSITIEDINKKAGIEEKDGIMKDRDGNVVDSNYGNTTNPTIAVFYPTLSNSNTTYPGQSTSRKTGFKYTYYSWNKSKIPDTNIQSMLFNGSYLLASRCMTNYSSNAEFRVRSVHSSITSGIHLCTGSSSGLSHYEVSNYAVRPVVTLKSDVIDINTDYDTEGVWRLK